MFCKKCGRELADGAKFCDGCGNAIATESAQAPVQLSKKQNVFSKLGKKKMTVILASVLVVAVAMVGIVLGVNAANNKPEKVAEKYVTGLMSGDPAAVVDCIPDFMLREIANEYGLMGVDKKSIINRMKMEITPEDIQSVRVLQSAIDYSFDCSEYLEDLEEYGATSFERMQIKDRCAVRVSALVSGESNEFYVVCIKLDNHWYAIDID